jgi:hypothetical protein
MLRRTPLLATTFVLKFYVIPSTVSYFVRRFSRMFIRRCVINSVLVKIGCTFFDNELLGEKGHAGRCVRHLSARLSGSPSALRHVKTENMLTDLDEI